MSQRQKLVAGNWKMNPALDGARELAAGISSGIDARTNSEILVCPAYVHLQAVGVALGSHSLVKLGAQDISTRDNGAYTSEISGSMLKELGCSHVIVGHSERRQYHGESSDLVAEKAAKALETGLVPLICVGETLEEREAGSTEQVIGNQLDAVLAKPGIQALENAVIAYEPVWAIGTGETATPEQAQAVHAFIRGKLASEDETIAGRIRILYGGSVKPGNAKSLFSKPDIDGGLIGGAALNAIDFLGIIQAADSIR